MLILFGTLQRMSPPQYKIKALKIDIFKAFIWVTFFQTFTPF